MVQVDVAVIGGGVTGLASALALAEPARRWRCSSAKRKPGPRHQHAQQRRHPRRPLLSDRLAQGALCVEGRDRLYRLLRHALAFRTRAAASWSSPPTITSARELEALKAKSHANGVTSVVSVDADFIKAKEPNVRAFAALWSPDTGIIEAEAFVKALEHLCRARDVAIVVGSPLIGAEHAAPTASRS